MTILPTWVYLLLLCCSIAVVLWGLLSPPHALPQWTLRHDKLWHTLAFGTFAVLASTVWPNASPVFLWCTLFVAGIGSECLQQLTNTRRFCWFDVAANGIGAAIGLMVSALLLHS